MILWDPRAQSRSTLVFCYLNTKRPQNITVVDDTAGSERRIDQGDIWLSNYETVTKITVVDHIIGSTSGKSIDLVFFFPENKTVNGYKKKRPSMILWDPRPRFDPVIMWLSHKKTVTTQRSWIRQSVKVSK